MKKNGFTLAEVLVVLGVIGVVAALTLPSLMSNTASAQIGPKLAKAVAMFDQANGALLSAQGVDSLLDTDLLTKNTYQSELLKYLKAASGGSVSNTPGGPSNSNKLAGITAKDGIVYQAHSPGSGEKNDDTPAHMNRIGVVLIDIDGDSGPAKPGTDLFAFDWYADGSIKPYGRQGDPDSSFNWETYCPGPDSNGNPQTPSNPWACAGHVFANNLKVLYE